LGQKTHPYGFRLGYNKPWRSRWYAGKDYADLLHEDVKLRKQLKDRLRSAGISAIDIERAANKLVIRLYTARPGIIIGRKGAEIDKLKAEVQKRTKREVHIDILEVHRPETDAQLVAESIALQLEKRVAFRRAMRKAVDSALRFGCKGIKVRVSGRLNGAEIARTEWYLQGQLPLHTLRADIDYGFSEAHTTYGEIGIKCWVYKGEILPGGQRKGLRNEPEPRRAPARDRDRRDRDRDRGPRSQDRPQDRSQDRPQEHGAAQAHPVEPSRGPSPILPPMAPPQPSWKQESKPEGAVAPPAGSGAPPEGEKK
jgi:small subunit ribosomal protein S3